MVGTLLLGQGRLQSRAYIDQYNQYSDSIHTIIQTEKVAQIDAMYNYSLREKENMRLKEEVMKDRLALLTTFILVVAIILSFISSLVSR